MNQANKLRNITVVSIGGGYRDYQVRSGLTSLPCSSKDPNKLSLVVSHTSGERLKAKTADYRGLRRAAPHVCASFRPLQSPGHGCPLTICPSFGKKMDLI